MNLRFSPRHADAAAALLVFAFAVVNSALLPRSMAALLAGEPAVDWRQFVESGRRVFDADLYSTTDRYGFRWSPVLAYAFSAIGGMGDGAWRLLHVAAAAALPTWPMRLVTLAAWPFWYDVEAGNVMIFVLLAAVWAVRGNAAGITAFIVLTLLIPRPLMLPVLAWILWKWPAWRIPAITLAVIHGVAVLASGWAFEWLTLLLTLGGEQVSPNNLGPTRWLGEYWLLIGVPFAAYLTYRQRLGWASLAISYPYVLPYYLLMLVLELPERLRTRAGSASHARLPPAG